MSALRSDQAAQGFIQSSPEIIQGQRPISLSGQPVLLPDCPHWEKVFQAEPLYCQRTPVVSCSSTLHHLLNDLPMGTGGFRKVPVPTPKPSLLQTDKTSSPSLSSQGNCSSSPPFQRPSTELDPFIDVFFLLGGPKLDAVFFRGKKKKNLQITFYKILKYANKRDYRIYKVWADEEEGRLHIFEFILTSIHKLRFLNVKLGTYTTCAFLIGIVYLQRTAEQKSPHTGTKQNGPQTFLTTHDNNSREGLKRRATELSDQSYLLEVPSLLQALLL